MRRSVAAVFAVLACVSLGLAQDRTAPPAAAAPTPTPVDQPRVAATGDCAGGDCAADACRLWGSAEYLLGWTRGQLLPPLVTTSPAGTPVGTVGVLGQPTTTILYGNTHVNTEGRDGGRFELGYWLND